MVERGGRSRFGALSKLRVTRNVVRETLRLYPPVPMMVREAAAPQRFRTRQVPKGAQIVLSPWHLQRHTRLWTDPDAFDPSRWERDADKDAIRNAYIPFSAGPRVCPGAGFAMAEACVLLTALLARFRFETEETPVPVAHLTVRTRDGLTLRARHRGSVSSAIPVENIDTDGRGEP